MFTQKNKNYWNVDKCKREEKCNLLHYFFLKFASILAALTRIYGIIDSLCIAYTTLFHIPNANFRLAYLLNFFGFNTSIWFGKMKWTKSIQKIESCQNQILIIFICFFILKTFIFYVLTVSFNSLSIEMNNWKIVLILDVDTIQLKALLIFMNLYLKLKFFYCYYWNSHLITHLKTHFNCY